MDLRKLDKSFYPANTHLKQALDLIDGQWIPNKTRGHGIVVISIRNLTFGIPLRSNIQHKSSYPTQGRHGLPHKGLDYSKALLVLDSSYISNEIFRIPNSERSKLKDKQHYITQKFSQYVERYVDAVNKEDKNILNSEGYRFSTLQNYHKELGINLK
ncbi:protein AbiQ [Oceanospirillum multiglobuliferum]|uniref:Uncharacterized protein n=1 Tax=Oceanospirillum multiglobuliferum TaxID=64969 RepID=A0A1T4N7E3_9GAMM|nr:hypothetical protein [Oceanospirillum multiglobuliferum]OPX55862.1 hypothetical protein BTE48_06600 [Oceanospirillum multiglobuliferum]SJZ75045.1 protein AbiQ [Oceanospirillum multiglobuliferum]